MKPVLDAAVPDGHATRRCLLKGGVTALTLLTVGAVRAQNTGYPERPIKIMVPGTAGGIYDLLARTLGGKLAEYYGQPVVVDNRTGAGGIIAAELAARAPADGYNLFVATIFQTVQPALKQKLPYDIEADFVPISFGASFPLILLVNNDVPVHDVAGLITYDRANAGSLSFASTGLGGGTHLSGELFNAKAGTHMLHVPYKGSAAAMTDLISGQVQVFFCDAPTALPQIQSGKVRALAVASAARVPMLPGLPPIAESGVPGFEAYTWAGFMAPKGTPPAIVSRLSTDIARALNDSAVRQRLADVGAEAKPSSPEEFGKMVHSEIRKWGHVVRAAGIKAD
jgi:tripartite-type tricarboxylate transporter receptor subunit TctC